MYILRDKDEASLGLPSGDFEIPLIIQDRIILNNSQVSADQPMFMLFLLF